MRGFKWAFRLGLESNRIAQAVMSLPASLPLNQEGIQGCGFICSRFRLSPYNMAQQKNVDKKFMPSEKKFRRRMLSRL